MQTKELIPSSRFSRWEPVQDALSGVSLANSTSRSGIVTLASEKVINASELVNVAVNGYNVALDVNLLSGAGFTGNDKDHERNASLAAMEDSTGKSSLSVENQQEFSRDVCRAAIFARLVSLSLARSGVRGPVLTLLVDILNAGLAPAFTSEAQ